MQIEIFTVCDFAQNYGDKLIVTGTFSFIKVESFPAVHPALSIVGRFAYDDTECGEKDYKLEFKDPNGNDIVPPANWKVLVQVEKGKIGYSNLIFSFTQLQFNLPGIYKIRFQTDGIERVFKLFIE
jgi:hypothetical protein